MDLQEAVKAGEEGLGILARPTECLEVRRGPKASKTTVLSLGRDIKAPGFEPKAGSFFEIVASRKNLCPWVIQVLDTNISDRS